MVRFGKVFKTYVLGRITVFMTGREAAKILLSGKDGVVSLNLFYTGKQVLGPTSLLTTNGEEHKKLRRLIGEPLSIDALKKHFDFINELAVQTLDTWPGRKVLVLEEASSVSSSRLTPVLQKKKNLHMVSFRSWQLRYCLGIYKYITIYVYISCLSVHA